MPSGLDLVKRAEDLCQNGGGASSAPGREAKFTRMPLHREDTCERLLRFTLYQQNQVEHLQCGAALVFFVHEPKLKQRMVDAIKLWDYSRPTVSQEDRVQGIFHDQFVGGRKLYLFITLVTAALDLPFLKISALGDPLA